jgi:hypothetical protein
MRQRNFFVGLLFAVLTFASLTWALGSRHYRWHHGWHNNACYESREGGHDGDMPHRDSQTENDSNNKSQE